MQLQCHDIYRWYMSNLNQSINHSTTLHDSQQPTRRNSNSSAMAAKSPVALIIGAGPNIGQSVARKFASKGYRVGLAARSVKESDSTDSQLNIPSDFSKTEDVVKAFDRVRKTFGIPSVVVYNGEPAVPTVVSSFCL